MEHAPKGPEVLPGLGPCEAADEISLLRGHSE